MTIARGFATACLLCFASLVFAAGTPPPPEVKRILEKMHKGQPTTSQEQKVLRDWGLNPARQADSHGPPGAGFAEGSVIPDDIQAILDRMKQGQRPSGADMSRLMQWRNDVQSKKADILQGDAQMRSDLEGAKPPGAAPAGSGDTYRGLLQGEIVIAPTQRLDRDGRDAYSHLRVSGQTTFPVIYTLRRPEQPGGPWGLTWLMRPDRQAGGNFSARWR